MKKILNPLKSSTHVLYHIAVIALSTAIALSLPFTMRFLAKKFLVYWSLIENEKIFLVSVELVVAILLILILNYAGRGLRDKKLSNMARAAGMVHFFRSEGFLAKRRVKKLIEKQGFARNIMIMGSTGFSTFADPTGDLYNVVQNCREAKIMLLNPYGEGARIRASSILQPDVTIERFQEQIMKSIEFLKGLKAVQKDIRLKLYEDPPFLKLAVLGDYLWVKHYHSGVDMRALAQYVFEHRQNCSSLYVPFRQYFLNSWNDPKIPEYDLESDELVYRSPVGNEERRERFGSDAVADDVPESLQQLLPTIKWFRKAADQGNDEAYRNLRLLLDQVENPTVRQYRRAAEEGDISMQFKLGLMYFNGIQVEQDKRESVKWLTMAAEKGNVAATQRLASIYYRGDGITQDRKEAARWLRRAAEASDVTAQYNLGYMYESGEGVETDRGEADKWYRLAAEQGFAMAQHKLGLLCLERDDDEQAYRSASEWFFKAAEQGYAPSQNNLAAMYYYGKGFTENKEEAAKWYLRAADQGDVNAQFALGTMYGQGKGVPRDHAEAVKWLRKAAEQGHLKADQILEKID